MQDITETVKFISLFSCLKPMLCMLSLTCMDNDKELREEDDRQEEAEVGEDQHCL